MNQPVGKLSGGERARVLIAQLIAPTKLIGYFGRISLPLLGLHVVGMTVFRAIIAASHMSSFDACRVLVQFLEARVLRRRAS